MSHPTKSESNSKKNPITLPSAGKPKPNPMRTEDRPTMPQELRATVPQDMSASVAKEFAKTHQAKADVPFVQPNEGEGSYTAARHYDDATREYIASGKSDAAAKAAAKAIDGPEGDELRKAEAIGKSHAATITKKN